MRRQTPSMKTGERPAGCKTSRCLSPREQFSLFESQRIVEYSKSYFCLGCHSSLTSCFKYLQSMRRVHESLTPPPPLLSILLIFPSLLFPSLIPSLAHSCPSPSLSSLHSRFFYFFNDPLFSAASVLSALLAASLSLSLSLFPPPSRSPISHLPFPPVLLPILLYLLSLARPPLVSIARIYSRLRESRLA